MKPLGHYTSDEQQEIEQAETPEPMSNQDLFQMIRARAFLARRVEQDRHPVLGDIAKMIASEVRAMDDYRLNNFLCFLTEAQQ